MNRLSDIYYTTESYLFPMVEEEIGEITEKMKEFLRILEVVPPSQLLQALLSAFIGNRFCQKRTGGGTVPEKCQTKPKRHW
jgi:hypothetical protein